VVIERYSNGCFAEKHPKRGGRKRGTPNKATRAVKEFLTALANDAAVQDAVRERILAGDAVAFFRVVDHVLGRPKESVELTGNVDIVARLEAARKRFAEAKRG
jgi:hypothetical protein